MSKSNENFIDVEGINEDDGAQASDSETNETNVSNQTEKKPEKGGNSKRNDSKPEEGEKSKQNGSNESSNLPYTRVIPKIKTIYDTLANGTQVTDWTNETFNDQTNREYHEYFAKRSQEHLRSNLHSDVNNQSTEVNFGAKKITFPTIKPASSRNVLTLEQDNLSVCEVIERTFPASHSTNFWTVTNDEGGNRRLHGIAAHLYDKTGEPMIRLIMTHYIWQAKTYLEGMIETAQDSTEPLSFNEMRRTLPMGPLTEQIGVFVSTVHNEYKTMSERVKQDQMISINEELIDRIHQGFNHQVKTEYLKLSTRAWDELTIHDTSLMVQLNSTESAVKVDTMALMDFRWKNMCGVYNVTAAMNREFKNVRNVLMKHLKGVADPAVFQMLQNGVATRPAEMFFELNYTCMGIFKIVEDAYWSTTGQTTSLLESSTTVLQRMWKQIETEKVGLASALKAMFGQVTLVKVINNKLVELSKQWSKVPNTGWPYTRISIGVLTVYEDLFENTPDICDKFPSTVGDAYKELRTWFLTACTRIKKVPTYEAPMRESALVDILFTKADKLQLEHQYPHLEPDAEECMFPDNASMIDDDRSVSTLGMSDQVSSSNDTRTNGTKRKATKQTKFQKNKLPNRGYDDTSVDGDPRFELMPPQPKGTQELTTLTPRGFPHLPQKGNRIWNDHKCWACLQRGGDNAHLPKYCPNLYFAVIFGKIKKFIPSAVRAQVSTSRGSDITTSELEGFIDKTFLKKMTKAWKGKDEPDALRSGSAFTKESLDKAKQSWDRMQKRIKDDNSSKSSASRTSGSSTHSKRRKRDEKAAAVSSDKSSDEDSDDVDFDQSSGQEDDSSDNDDE